MHNFSSLLYLFWHLQRGPFSRIFGKISFLHLTLLNFIFFVNFREGKVCRFFYTNDLGQFSIAQGVSEKVQKSKTWGGDFFFKIHNIFIYHWKAVEKCNPMALFIFSFSLQGV